MQTMEELSQRDRAGGAVGGSSQVAVDFITQAIVEGEIQPSERLREVDLARRIGISRTPVREALRTLREQGLVEIHPHRGATVRSYDADTLNDMYQLRALLEGHTARLAAARITPAEVQALHDSCDRFDTLIDTADFRDLVRENSTFHSTVQTAARDDRLAGMLRTVVELPLVFRSYIWFSPEQRHASSIAHRQLARLLGAGEGERAERVMKEHVLAARDVLVAHLRDQGDLSVSEDLT
jgi:DNA-binding GntR family transcriptional regulator